MVIGDRLRQIRESKKMSQGVIEQRTGLLRCYTSRVECGHTIPSLETLQKYAQALEIPLYQLFHDGEKDVQALVLPTTNGNGELSTKEQRAAAEVARMFSQVKRHRDRELIRFMIRKLCSGGGLSDTPTK